MHHNNNKDATGTEHASADHLRSQDPYLSSVLKASGHKGRANYSEAINAVMDEMSGVATSRRAALLNSRQP